jgi:(1->4)-alpha-D-glucan 1-alpha-D-glucosylmutase
MRARLNVLSDVPDEWSAAFRRWRELNRQLERELDGDPVPDPNEQYLLYQTLVGTWPLAPFSAEARREYTARIVQYMEKALREAKIHTSWMNPSEAYEAKVREFVTAIFASEQQHPLIEELKNLAIDELTPIEAISKLYELQQKARRD